MNDTRINGDTPIGTIARRFPATIDLFESFEVDYACKGGRALAEACDAAGIDSAAVMHAIQPLTAAEPAEPTIADLVHTILFEQHAHERAVMGDLADLLRRCDSDAPEIARIRRLFTALSTLIQDHMSREERDLFPAAEQLENAFGGGELPLRSSLASRHCVEFVEHE